MDFFDKIGDRKIILILEMSIAALIGIAHLVLFFFIKKTDFNNIFDSFESSPLFDFSIDDNCGKRKFSHSAKIFKNFCRVKFFPFLIIVA